MLQFAAPTVYEAPPALREGLQAVLAGLAQAHGFDGAVYIHLGHGFRGVGAPTTCMQPRRLVATLGFDAAAYLRRGYLALDPLAARACESYAPFAWRLAEIAGGAGLIRAMAAWGLRAGIVTPVQDYALGPALLNLYGPDGCGRSADLGALMLAAAQVHASARDLPRGPAPETALSAREMEVLRLAALGRTEEETALELALSRRGVKFHLGRAMEKLGASNKTAAVATAVSAGMIRL